MSVTMEPSTTRNTSLPISQKEVVSLAIEAHYSNLQTGIRVLVARSGLVDGETKIVETIEKRTFSSFYLFSIRFRFGSDDG